jgi:hypothetical protein
LSTSAAKPRRSGIGRLLGNAMMAIDRRLGWERLPPPLGLLVIFGVRTVLRERNLFDPETLPALDRPPVGPPDPANLDTRTVDGTYNDLNLPSMGMAGSRFGRNVPIDRKYESPSTLMDPNPREVSLALMTQEAFQPATGANALTAAWLQFMIRGGFSHGTSPKDHPFEVELADDDPWPQRPMLIMRTPPDPTRPPGRDDLPPTYVNAHAHWWDAKQVYGTTKEEQAFLRSGEDGKLRIDAKGLLPFPTDPDHNPTLIPGFWLGLAMMQVLFAREHNSICDKLRAEYPSWSDERLFTRARLINAAVINKIHSVDWSPTVINHPTTRAALHADFWGVAGQWIHNHFGRISGSRLISGAMGAPTEHYGVPFAITEEFVAIYRMHQMIPDDYDFRSVGDDRSLKQATLQDISGPPAIGVLEQLSMTDVLYTFGTMNAGLVTLHNYPRHLQHFERPDGNIMDMAAVDLLRCRELGVPRYNEFRRLLHLAPARDFESLTDNPAWAEQIRRIYKDDIERVDLLVGMYAEPRPRGFAFSNTAFHLFVLTAPRRLSSDRFLSSDFSPKVYTQTGIEWVERNTMGTILLRHHPELGAAMGPVRNAFRPWKRVAGSARS